MEKARCNCYRDKKEEEERANPANYTDEIAGGGGGGGGGEVDPDNMTAKTEGFFTYTDSMRAAYCFIMTSSRLK